jgi:hypothetical protein
VVSANPVFFSDELSKDMLNAPLYPVPVGDVRVTAEALPANAISEATATTKRPIFFRCFMFLPGLAQRTRLSDS